MNKSSLGSSISFIVYLHLDVYVCVCTRRMGGYGILGEKNLKSFEKGI